MAAPLPNMGSLSSRAPPLVAIHYFGRQVNNGITYVRCQWAGSYVQTFDTSKDNIVKEFQALGYNPIYKFTFNGIVFHRFIMGTTHWIPLHVLESEMIVSICMKCKNNWECRCDHPHIEVDSDDE